MNEQSGTISQEQQRIQHVYAKRKQSGSDYWYRWHQQASQWERYRLRSVASAMLSRLGWQDLSAMDVLDVGCGAGGWLRTLMEWGIPAHQLHGIDLLEERIAYTKSLTPGMDLRMASGWDIPYDDCSMDLVSAQTVFSSILDADARALLAGEMVRVTKPNGVILLYDFHIADPRNRDTVGISPREIRRIFPKLPLRLRTLTLAPPLARRLTRISPFVAAFAEALLPLLRTHRLYLLRKT